MDKKIFREKSLERLNSPDEFDKYVRVSTPGIWILVAGILFVLAGVFVWGIWGDIKNYVDVALMETEDGKCYCLINGEDMDGIKEGMTIECEGQEFTVSNLSNYDNFDTIDQGWARVYQMLGIGDDQWIYRADASGAPYSEEKGEKIYKAKILVEELKPFGFIFN